MIQLELQRDAEKMKKQEEMREIHRKREEEAIMRQEQIRRETIAYDHKLK